MPLYSCPCCGFLTMGSETRDSFEICSVCAWEDDPVQFENPDFEGGANRLSLHQAQRNFKVIGDSDTTQVGSEGDT